MTSLDGQIGLHRPSATLPREPTPLHPSAAWFSGRMRTYVYIYIHVTVNASFPVWQWSSALGSVGFPNGYHRAGETASVYINCSACVSAYFYHCEY